MIDIDDIVEKLFEVNAEIDPTTFQPTITIKAVLVMEFMQDLSTEHTQDEIHEAFGRAVSLVYRKGVDKLHDIHKASSLIMCVLCEKTITGKGCVHIRQEDIWICKECRELNLNTPDLSQCMYTGCEITDLVPPYHSMCISHQGLCICGACTNAPGNDGVCVYD